MIGAALAQGFAIFFLVTSLGHISGGMELLEFAIRLIEIEFQVISIQPSLLELRWAAKWIRFWLYFI